MSRCRGRHQFKVSEEAISRPPHQYPGAWSEPVPGQGAARPWAAAVRVTQSHRLKSLPGVVMCVAVGHCSAAWLPTKQQFFLRPKNKSKSVHEAGSNDQRAAAEEKVGLSLPLRHLPQPQAHQARLRRPQPSARPPARSQPHLVLLMRQTTAAAGPLPPAGGVQGQQLRWTTQVSCTPAAGRGQTCSSTRQPALKQ